MTVRRAPSVSHQLIRPTPIDPVVRPLLDLGDVLVVDPEAELANLPVRPAEQGQDGVREGQFLGHALRLQGGEPRLDVARVGPGDRVVLGQHLDELGTRTDFPSMPITHPPSTFMTRGARSFMLSGKRS